METRTSETMTTSGDANAKLSQIYHAALESERSASEMHSEHWRIAPAELPWLVTPQI